MGINIDKICEGHKQVKVMEYLAAVVSHGVYKFQLVVFKMSASNFLI